MKKNKIMLIESFFLSFCSVVWAETDPAEEQLSGIMQVLLSALAWIAAAIGLGTLIMLGIRFVLSGANEKATVKGRLPLFLVGMGLIILSASIAGFLANVAGNENDAQVVGTAIGLVDGQVGHYNNGTTTHISDSGTEHGGSGGKFDSEHNTKFNEDDSMYDPYETASATKLSVVDGKKYASLKTKEYSDEGGQFLYWEIRHEDGSKTYINQKDYEGFVSDSDEGVRVRPIYTNDLKKRDIQEWSNIEVYADAGVNLNYHDGLIWKNMEIDWKHSLLKKENFLGWEVKVMDPSNPGSGPINTYMVDSQKISVEDFMNKDKDESKYKYVICPIIEG